MTFETKRQCDSLLGDWQDEDGNNITIGEDENIQDHGQDEENHWDGPFTQPDPASPTSVSPAAMSPAPASPALGSPGPISPALVSPAQWPHGFNSPHFTLVLAGYLLDSSSSILIFRLVG